jgi:hypothetical protein
MQCAVKQERERRERRRGEYRLNGSDESRGGNKVWKCSRRMDKGKVHNVKLRLKERALEQEYSNIITHIN